MEIKEQLMAKIESASQIYEILKEYPVNERGSLFQLVEQFNQADWAEYYKAQSGDVKYTTGSLQPY